MKTLLALNLLIFIISGSLGFIFQAKRESNILLRNSELQLRFAETGILQNWLETLAEAVDQDKVSTGYSIEFDRAGRNLISSFYPSKKVSLDWSSYRSLGTSDRVNKLAFLENALAKDNSWDRILGITAFFRLTNHYPEKIHSGYEETIVSTEAHQAYSKIFSVLAKELEYSDIGTKSVFFGCFIKSTSNGNLLAYIPKRSDVLPALLPSFEKQIFRQKTGLGETSLDIIPGLPLSDINEENSYPLKISFCISAAAFLIAIWLVWKIVSEEKLQVLHRVTFLNQVVHELNTPLSAIKLHAQILEKTVQGNESVDSIKSSIDRMIKLFEEITELYRPNAVPHLRKIDGLEFMIFMQKLAAHSQGKVSIEGGIRRAITTDLFQLEIVLGNLIQNGIRYGDQVNIKVEDFGEAVKIYVSDHGPGILAREAKKIFKPYFRSVAAIRRVPDGLGLGLSLAAKIASALRIELTLTNPGNPGAVFCLMLKREDRNEENIDC